MNHNQEQILIMSSNLVTEKLSCPKLEFWINHKDHTTACHNIPSFFVFFSFYKTSMLMNVSPPWRRQNCMNSRPSLEEIPRLRSYYTIKVQIIDWHLLDCDKRTNVYPRGWKKLLFWGQFVHHQSQWKGTNLLRDKVTKIFQMF